MPDFLYTSPRTNRSYRLVPDDPNYVPTELDKQEYAAYIEQQETASAQPAPAQPAPVQPTAEAPDSGQSIGGARLSSAIQGITTIPGTIAQGVGATFLSPFGITALEESGKYAAQKARELTPIDPKYQGNLSVELFGAGGQAVGQLASALATGGGTIGTNVALAQAAAMGAASGAESAERRGLTGINRLNEVLGYGASEVITERMFGLGSKSFFKPAAGLQAKAVKAGTTVLGESVEESGAGLLTNIVSNLTAIGTNIPSPDILSVEALKSYARQGLSGAVGGTVFAGAQMAMGEQATSQPTTTVTGRDPNTGATVDISDLTEQQIEDRGFTDVRTSVIPDSSLTAEIIESPNERVANILTEVGLNSATPVENQAFIDSLNQAGIPVDPAIIAAPAAPAAEAPATPTPTVAPATPTPTVAPAAPAAPTAAEAPIPTVEVTPTETGVAPAAQPPITPPTVEPTPTPTPTPDATQIGQVTESDLSKYPDRNEVGPPAETGDRNRPVEGGQVEQAVAQEQAVTPPLPSGATPTETGTLPTTPMTGVSGEAAPAAAQAPTAAASTAAAPTAAAAQAPTAAVPTAAAPTAAVPTAAAPTAAAPTTAAAAPTAAAPTAAAPTAAAAPTEAAAAAAAPTATAPTETVEEPEAPARQQNSDIFGQDDPNVDPNAQVDDYLAETPTESLAEDLAQFFGISDRPKEVQSFNELINNFIKPFVFDSSLPISESQTLKAQEILDSLSLGSDMNAFRQRMIAMDPRLGSMDAVPGAVLGELYNYALKLNDNGAFYQSMRDLGSKLPYSYGSSGESAGRGLGIISFYVRKSPRFKALNQHENSANKKAATKGVATAEQLAAISRASNDGASEATLESNLSATDANGTNVISTLDSLAANAAPVESPVEETRRPVAASDLATGAKAAENVDPEGFKQRQIASKKAKNKAKKDKGIPPNLEEDGGKAYAPAETPLGQTKGKVTKADVFSAAARLFNLRPSNIVVIDTEVPNARGKQYAGEVDLSTKVITINLRNVKDVEHLDRVLQEEVDHLVFQDPAVQADVKLLTENVPADLVQDMQDQGYEDSVQKEEAVIRYARNLASNAQTKSLWQNLLESIKSAFRRIFNSPPTQYELTRAAQRFVARSAEGYPTQGSGTGQRSSLTPEEGDMEEGDMEEGDMEEGDAEETELGEDAYLQETAEKEATSATPKKNVTAKVKVPKTEAEANLEATKNYIAAADRNVVNGGKPAKVKNAAAKLLSEASNLQKRKIKYGLTQAAQDNFLANLTQDLVNLGVPQQTAYEAARRAWAKYATKKRNSDDNAALAAARRAQKEAADKNKVPLTAQEEAQKKATETANAYTSRFDKSQTETLTAEQVQDPVAVALKNAEKVPRISAAFDTSPQAKNAFLTGLNSQLIRLGVEPTAAWTASNRAWLKYQTTRTARVMKLRSDIAKYGFARVLAKELASIPVHLQRNPDYMKSVMRKILIAGGITETVADASIPLLMPQFTKAVADAREVAVRKFIDGNAVLKKKAKEKPTEFDKLIKAVRLGATDPTYSPSVPFAKENKWQRFTTEDHEKMIALDEEINDESLPPLIRAQKALELAQLADKRMNDPKALKILTEYIVNNTLSGIGTAAIQAFTPIYSMGVRVTTDGVRGLLNGDTNRFFASLYSLFDAADAVLTELSYAFKTDSFRYGQQAELAKASQLRRILNDNIEIFKNPKSGEQKVIAAAKIAMAAPDYVRRLYSSMDTATQSLFLRQVQNIGGYDILKKSGMSLKEFKGMLDAKRQVRDALIAKLTAEGQYTRSQIRLIAEDAAMMEYGNLIIDAVGDTGAQDVTDLLKTAPLEAKSEIGVSDLKENPEGHVIPAMIQFLEGLTESVNAHVPESAQGAGDLAFRLLIGYPKTALQMLNRSLYYSPVGFYRAYLNRRYERDVREGKIDPEVVKRKYSMLNTQSQKEQRYAESMVGTAAIAILFGLLLAERDKEEEDKLLKVHNLGPANRAEKQIWRAAGNVEQSIQWRPTKNSPWISVSWAKAGLESLAPVLMTVGTLYDVTSDSKSAQSTALDKSMLIAGGVLGGMNRPLSGLQDLGQILTGEKNSISSRSLASFAGFRASGLIPFSSLLKTSNKLAGPRDLSNAKSSLLAQIPIAGPSLTEPGLNLFGDSLGSTPNELTYKLPIFPVQIGMQTKDVPFYENILSKGQFPPVKLRSNFEKSYGPVTDSTWRQFVQIRGQYLKSQITTRWNSLDKLNPKKYNDIIDDIAQSADDKAVKQLKLKPVKK